VCAIDDVSHRLPPMLSCEVLSWYVGLVLLGGRSGRW
jgi:hypothetical protein